MTYYDTKLHFNAYEGCYFLILPPLLVVLFLSLSLLKVEVLLIKDWRRYQIYSGAAGRHPGAFRNFCRSHRGSGVAASLTVAMHILPHLNSSGWPYYNRSG
jgi:hypothetical protein